MTLERVDDLSHREFVAGAAGGLAGLGLPSLFGATAATGAVREVVLETREMTWELSPGKQIRAMPYNGRVPGPEIRVKEGERLRVVLKNALAEPTTIHWHGVDVPAAPLLKDTVDVEAHMGSAEIEFTAHNPGNWFFHCHKPMHMGGGMIALVTIAG